MPYVGPGDLQTFAGWWGLRAYSAATAGNNCADISATGGGTTTTIKTLANGNFDFASAHAALGGNSGFFAKIYDQTGGGHDWVQATGAQQPKINLNALQSATLPQIDCTGASEFVTKFFMSDAGTFTVTNPFTIVAAVKPAGNWTLQQSFIRNGSGGQGLYYDSATQVGFWNQNFTDAGPFTWSINNYHRIIAVNNGASNSLFCLDGSVTTFAGDTTAWQTAGVTFGLDNGGGDITAVEFGAAASGFSSANATAMDANINNYWFAAPAGGPPYNPWPLWGPTLAQRTMLGWTKKLGLWRPERKPRKSLWVPAYG